MEDTKEFIKAYHDFRESVDFSQSGILPELDDLTAYMLMGVPPVPADNDPSEEAPIEAIDQRVSILKAVFVELNRDQSPPLSKARFRVQHPLFSTVCTPESLWVRQRQSPHKDP